VTETLPEARVPIDQVLQSIALEPTIWMRFAAFWNEGNDGAKWFPTAVELTSGAPPPSFNEGFWKYRAAVLSASTIAGEDAAAVLKMAA
jgi:hypothetical protein